MTSLVDKGKRIGEMRLDGPLIYEIAFSFYFVIAFFQTSTYTDYFPGNFLHELSFIPLIMVLFKIFVLDYDTKSRLIVNLVALALLVLTWRASGSYLIFPMGIFILGAKNVDFRRIMYLYLVLGTILLAFIFFSSLFGLTKNLVYHRGVDTVRRSFGIIYPTDFAAHVLYLVLAYCYLYFKKVSWRSYLVFCLLAYGLNKYCDARLSAYALLILIPVIFIGQKANQGNRLCKFIASFYWTLPALSAYVMLLMTYLYSPQRTLLERVNNVLSGRLFFGHEALMKYPFKWLGQRIVEHGFGGNSGHMIATGDNSSYFFVDSSFVRTFIIYGIIVLLLVVIMMTVISWQSIATHDFALASVLVIVTISAVVEQRLLDFGYDPFLLATFAQCYLIHKKGKLTEVKN